MELHVFNMANCSFMQELKILSDRAADKTRNISKSYAGDVLVFCVSYERKVGVDIEKQTKRAPETMKHFVDKFSTFQIKDVPKAIDEKWFYRAWTAMESFFKLTGAGFSTEKSFILDLKQQSILRDGIKVASLSHFEIDDYVICLCSNTTFTKQNIKLSFYGWKEIL